MRNTTAFVIAPFTDIEVLQSSCAPHRLLEVKQSTGQRVDRSQTTRRETNRRLETLTEKNALEKLVAGNINSRTSHTTLLIIDVINHFEFLDGNRILRNALPLAPRLAKLKKRAKSAGIPVVYVNDNFGQWRSDARKLVDYCVRPKAPGRTFVQLLQPDPDDYFVIKPMHSAFYQTPLETLLRSLKASSLILCGLATNSCIVCTAHDANMRDFRLFVPSDCSAARTRREHQQAIQHLRDMVHVETGASTRLRLESLGTTR